MEVFEEHQRASEDDPRLSHGSYSPLLLQQTPPIPTCLCSSLPASPQLQTTLTPLNTTPAIRAGAHQLQSRSKPSSSAVTEGFYILFFPQRRFVEDSLRQGKNCLPGLPVQHPGKFLWPSLGEHRAALITGRELESAQMSLTTLRFVLEPN